MMIAQSQNDSGDAGKTKIGLEKKVLQARAALDAVHEATWGFAYYSDKLKRNIRPYTTNATLLMEIKQRVAQAIDQWYI